MIRRPPSSTLFPYPPLFRSRAHQRGPAALLGQGGCDQRLTWVPSLVEQLGTDEPLLRHNLAVNAAHPHFFRSEEHTSELQSQSNLVCRLLLEKKKRIYSNLITSLQLWFMDIIFISINRVIHIVTIYISTSVDRRVLASIVTTSRDICMLCRRR